MPKFLEKGGQGREIWIDVCPFSGEIEYLVYGYYDSGDPKSCASLDAARLYAA